MNIVNRMLVWMGARTSARYTRKLNSMQAEIDVLRHDQRRMLDERKRLVYQIEYLQQQSFRSNQQPRSNL